MTMGNSASGLQPGLLSTKLFIPPDCFLNHLTDREIEVLKHIADGPAMSDIAQDLFLKE